MDLSTIIGILSGLVLIGTTIWGTGHIDVFVHIPSMMIVFGGAMAAIFVNFPLKEVVGVISVVRKAFTNEESREVATIERFVEISQRTRREGILAIDAELKKINDEFMRIGLEMAVDGTEPDMIKEVMETELTFLIERHERGQQIFTSLGSYAPAFGMIGTLIGLISMLRNLNDPSSIGEGMAVALITTFYGTFLANLVFLPIAGKLKNRTDDEIIRKRMIIDGIIAIQNGEHPRNIEMKLLNYLPPKLRRTVKTMKRP